jgi:N-acetylneuraminic acid mutarotase
MRRALLASCLLILATVPSIAAVGATSGQASGATGLWTKAASVHTGRVKHTATLLRSGNVLIVGGVDHTNHALASAEVYDPSKNQWRPAGSMATARLEHTATLLSNGKVLVAGGFDAPPFPSNSLASAELFDPATSTWSPAARMLQPRAGHTATTLADGRVLVVGGLGYTFIRDRFSPGGQVSAEIYDPTSDHWSATAPMGQYRVGQTATRLRDGRVLVAGGANYSPTFRLSEIYDARRDQWVSAAPMATGRVGHAATQLPNGDVLVVGGEGAEQPNTQTIALTSAELYDPRTNVWVTVASVADVHVEHEATVLRNGKVLVVGDGISQPELYDPARNVWSTTGPPMGGHLDSATLLADGRVVLVGGYGNESLESVLLYDPNGVAPVSRQPLDLRVIAAVVLVALLIVAGFAWSSPAVRRRVKGWGPHDQPEEWIT